jgi:hypothetical protein
MSGRCPDCGQARRLSICECRLHPEPTHGSYPQFNPRCALCWADVWAALERSLRIAAWRVIVNAGRQAEP